MNTYELPSHGIVPRPEFQLRSLSIPMRWEVTRRHPYYQAFWTTARDWHQRHPLKEGKEGRAEEYLRLGAVAILNGIGVGSEPPDPRTLFSDLDEAEIKSAWLSGAVHPLTHRGMAGILLTKLSKDTLATLGMLFLEASCDDPDEGPPKKVCSMINLQSSDKEGLNQFPDEPLVSINPTASNRQVIESINNLQKEWKDNLGLTEQRDRSDKHKQYLEVWDRREGWVKGRYDLSEEKTLREIAEENGESISTVNNHYRRAFELIIGHPYSPDLWWRTMGIHKVVQPGFVKSVVSRQRPTASPTRRPVPESQLGADLDAVNYQQTPSGNEYTYEEVVWDVRDLVSKGHSDEEIMQSLGMRADSAECGKFIGWIRSRSSDE